MTYAHDFYDPHSAALHAGCSHHYVGIGVGAVLVKGKGASSFQNGKGVVVTTKGKADWRSA